MLVNHMQKIYYHKFESGSEFIAPNVYLHTDAESDILRLLKSGYVEEIEIKISLSDFKNDFKKNIRVATGETQTWGKNTYKKYETKNKHESLSMGKLYINRFFFYIPWYLEEKVTPLIPEHAGLIVFTMNGSIKTVKIAPLLHKEKISDKLKYKTARKFIFKYWNNNVPAYHYKDYIRMIKNLSVLFIK